MITIDETAAGKIMSALKGGLECAYSLSCEESARDQKALEEAIGLLVVAISMQSDCCPSAPGSV